MTKAQLEEELKKARELIDQQRELIVKLQHENSAILAGNGVVSKKEFDTVVKDLEHSKEVCRVTDELLEKKETTIEKARAVIQKQQEEFAELKRINDKNTALAHEELEMRNKLFKKIDELEEEIETLKKSKINNERKYNERGAGRKKTVDIEAIQKLRAEGKTQEQVARELNISISTVRRNEKGGA